MGNTVTSHVTHVTAVSADDVGGKVSLFRTVPFTMSELAAVLAGLVLVIAKSTVEHGEFSKLLSLVIVLLVRSRSGLVDAERFKSIQTNGRHAHHSILTVAMTLLISLTQA